MSVEVHLDDLLGREVTALDGSRVGRLHEVRVAQQGSDFVVTEYLIGVGGLLERLGVKIWRSHAGGAGSGYIARWDQLDLADPTNPRLKCPASELRRP